MVKWLAVSVLHAGARGSIPGMARQTHPMPVLSVEGLPTLPLYVLYNVVVSPGGCIKALSCLNDASKDRTPHVD